MLWCWQKAGSSATFMSLLLTGTPTEPALNAEVLADEASLRRVSLIDDAGALVEVMWNGTGLVDSSGLAASDGVLSGTDGLSWAFVAEGTTVIAAEDLGASATCELDAMALRWDEEDLVVTIARTDSSPCSLEIMWTGSRPETVEVDDIATTAWTHDSALGVVVLALTGGTVRLSPAVR